MSARRFLDWPEFAIGDGERIQDLLFMIDLLAAWMRARPRPFRASATLLAATLLCPIFRSEKGADYQHAADGFRRHFRGIADETARTAEFFGRCRPTILEVVQVPEDVFQREFSFFFDDRF